MTTPAKVDDLLARLGVELASDLGSSALSVELPSGLVASSLGLELGSPLGLFAPTAKSLSLELGSPVGPFAPTTEDASQQQASQLQASQPKNLGDSGHPVAARPAAGSPLAQCEAAPASQDSDKELSFEASEAGEAECAFDSDEELDFDVEVAATEPLGRGDPPAVPSDRCWPPRLGRGRRHSAGALPHRAGAATLVWEDGHEPGAVPLAAVDGAARTTLVGSGRSPPRLAVPRPPFAASISAPGLPLWLASAASAAGSCTRARADTASGSASGSASRSTGQSASPGRLPGSGGVVEDARWAGPSDLELFGGELAAEVEVEGSVGGPQTVRRGALDHHLWALRRDFEGLLLAADEQHLLREAWQAGRDVAHDGPPPTLATASAAAAVVRAGAETAVQLRKLQGLARRFKALRPLPPSPARGDRAALDGEARRALLEEQAALDTRRHLGTTTDDTMLQL